MKFTQLRKHLIGLAGIVVLVSALLPAVSLAMEEEGGGKTFSFFDIWALPRV